MDDMIDIDDTESDGLSISVESGSIMVRYGERRLI
jgi:hypothetical protein